MATDNPCTLLTDDVEVKITALEAIETTMTAQVTAAKTLLDDYAGGATVVATLDTALESLTPQTIGYGLGSMQSDLSTFAGSCLDRALTELNKKIDDMNSVISDAFDDIGVIASLPEKAIMQSLQNLENALRLLKIPQLEIGLDNMLNCLADSALPDCIDTIDAINTRIDTVNSNLYLWQDGSFAINNIIEASSLAAAVKTNLRTVETAVNTVRTVAITNIETVIASSTVVPEVYY